MKFKRYECKSYQIGLTAHSNIDHYGSNQISLKMNEVRLLVLFPNNIRNESC
jgi:hypothetical protein